MLSNLTTAEFVGITVNMKAKLITRFKDVTSDGDNIEWVLWRLPKPAPPSQHDYKYRAAFIVKGIRVVGFDNVPEASYFQPSLTTVLQSFEEVGNASLELLVAQIEGAKTNSKREGIQPKLLVRESSGKAPRK